MLSYLLSFFRSKTVDSVMESFYSAIQDLALVRQKNLDRSAEIKEEIDELQFEHAICRSEAERADTVADKLKALVSG